MYRFTKHPKNEKKSKRCNKLQLNDGRNGPHFEWNQIKIKKIPNRWTFCTQVIFFNRYTTTRREIRTSETRLSLSLVENTSPEESRWNFWRQKSKKRRATKHSQWSYGASSLSGLHLWSNLLRAKSSSFHCRAKTSSWKPPFCVRPPLDPLSATSTWNWNNTKGARSCEHPKSVMNG